MPERVDLLSTLPPDVRDDAQRIYDEIGRTVGEEEPDPRDFVAELHRRGLLDEGQLREAVMALASLRVRRREQTPSKSETAPQVLGRLGAGAMGEVLIAKDPGLNRIVAVKRLHPEGARRKALLRRFYTEAQVTAQLDHPSIVPIHGLVESDDGGLSYSMKLVRGRTLEDYLDEARDQSRRGEPDVEHALPARLERFLHVCDALAYAHERGVLHRDLKPENIMVGAFGEVLVMDWGIAKLLDRGDDDEHDLAELGGPTSPSGSAKATKGTRVGTVMGTPRYMSPEQAEGRTDILDPRSDQYALGLILFELVSLAAAVRDDLELEEALRWAREARKQPLKHAFGGRIPRELAAIVDKATRKDRDQRYAGVADLAEDIRRYLRDEEVAARPDSLLQRAQRWLGHHRQLTLNLGFLLTLGFVGVTAAGLVGTVATVAYLDHRAGVREQQLTEVLQLVVGRARDMDAEVHRVEGLASGLAYAAAHALASPPPDLPYDPSRSEPPDRHKGGRYSWPVSVDWPRVSSASSSPSRRDVEVMAGLGPQLARVLVESEPKAPGKVSARERHKLVAERGVPVVWARVASRDGLEASIPGTGALLTSAPDPRKQDWYTAPKGRRGPAWTGPAVDPRGQGLVLTASVPVSDAEGRALGVAAVDMSVEHLVSFVAAPEGAEGAWLLDDEGRVVVDHQLEARSVDRFDPKPFHRADVVEAVGRSRNGWLDTSDGQLAVWSRLPTLGLTYVVVADPSLLTRRQQAKRAALDRR